MTSSTATKCSAQGCKNTASVGALCNAHYRRMLRKNDLQESAPVMRRLYTAEDRLEARSTPIPFSGCRIWLGANVPAGYGVMQFDGRQTYSHRVSWILKNGPIPQGMQILHHCDTPSCVNPDHLFIGTGKDNMQDKMSKNRWRGGAPRGDRNPMRVHIGIGAGDKNNNAKLSKNQVDEIRATYKRGITRQVDIAKKFGVRQSHVSSIIRGAVWE